MPTSLLVWLLCRDARMSWPASAIEMPRAHAVAFAIASLVTRFLPGCLDMRRGFATLYFRR